MRKAPIIGVALVVFLGSAYVTADVYDVVPGVLTTRPVIADPAPYPEISAAAAPAPAILPDGAPSPARDVADMVAELGKHPGLGPSPSIEMLDGLTGERIASVRPNQVGPPASSTKVLTAVAALHALGGDMTIDTRTVLQGDSVILVGGGDLLLTTGPSKPDVIGRASLTELAEQTATRLRSLGKTSVTLGYDTSIFEGRGSSDWEQRDYLWVIPMSPMAMFDKPVSSQLPRGVDYALETAKVFAAELAAQGIEIQGDGIKPLTAGEGAIDLGVVHSAKVEDVIEYMMKVSDNSITEVMARLVSIKRGGGRTAQDGADAVIATLADMGVSTAGLVLKDSCGLSSNNMISAELLAELVYMAMDGNHPELVPLITSFPVSYLDGTLHERQLGAAGFVRAKTGTLPKVVSLTGIAQADSGATYVFSIVGTRLENTWEARMAIDQFMVKLIAEG